MALSEVCVAKHVTFKNTAAQSRVGDYHATRVTARACPLLIPRLVFRTVAREKAGKGQQ